MSDSIKGNRMKFANWKDSLESKGLKFNKSTKLMVSGSIDELPIRKIDPSGVCGERVSKNFMLCVKCRKWIHGRCT